MLVPVVVTFVFAVGMVTRVIAGGAGGGVAASVVAGVDGGGYGDPGRFSVVPVVVAVVVLLAPVVMVMVVLIAEVVAVCSEGGRGGTDGIWQWGRW